MAGNPILSSTATASTGYFDCQVQAAENEQGSPEYTMTLQAGNTRIEQITLTSQLTYRLQVSGLSQAERNDVLENGLTCSVTAKNSERCGNGESPALSDSISSFTPQVQRPAPLQLPQGSTAGRCQLRLTEQPGPPPPQPGEHLTGPVLSTQIWHKLQCYYSGTNSAKHSK